tara:strand:+ start:1157 stop:2257 length:1101 start_codon:yes stop_codon:yes gene_type:complete
MEYAIIVIISLLVGVFLSTFIYNKSNNSLNNETLSKNIEHLLEIQKKDWDRGQSDFKGILEPLKGNLEKLDKQVRDMEAKREGAYKSLEKELEHLGKFQSQLQETTHGLESALRSSSSRGRWGEIKLKNIIELAGLQEHIDFVEQTTTHGKDGTIRPDMVVNLPNGGVVIIDSKAPLKAYLDANDTQDDSLKQKLLLDHSKSMRQFMKSLSNKEYWSQFSESPDLVVMFIPLESALYTSFEYDKDLFDDALKSKVLIVSAVSLLALLKAIAYGWMQVKLDENTQKIADEGRLVYDRFVKFYGMFEEIGKRLTSAMTSYNKALGSMQSRIIPSMRRLKEMGAGSDNINNSDLLDVEVSQDEKEDIMA